MENLKDETQLCKLAFKYGSDKCPKIKHSYTPYYYNSFNKRRDEIKKLLEIGIGFSGVIKHSVGATGSYTIGASLFMWRDFFPNAQIYGADINPDTIFEQYRIKTFLCDQSKPAELDKLIGEIGTDIDIIIDDASHNIQDQIFTCRYLLPKLPNTVYTIEDVTSPKLVIHGLSDFNYEVPQIPRKYRDDRLVIVTK